MNMMERMRLEARHNDRISILDREQARLERQIAALEGRRQSVINNINAELRQLRVLQRG